VKTLTPGDRAIDHQLAELEAAKRHEMQRAFLHAYWRHALRRRAVEEVTE